MEIIIHSNLCFRFGMYTIEFLLIIESPPDKLLQVEPFDCLPQLVCRKCQLILSQYYNTKQNFLEKQKELRAKVQENVSNC